NRTQRALSPTGERTSTWATWNQWVWEKSGSLRPNVRSTMTMGRFWSRQSPSVMSSGTSNWNAYA
ncbi:hypothetical protein KR084_001320, partial [Drosophila pseudotakahashii]